MKRLSYSEIRCRENQDGDEGLLRQREERLVSLVRRLFGIVFLLFFFVGVSSAQKTCTVKGKIQSKESEAVQPLPSASVAVLLDKDSSIVKGTVSDKEGNFILRFQPQSGKKYSLKASFMGMRSLYRALPDSAATVNVGALVLEDNDIQIGEVVVTAEQKDVVVKGDTAIINAGAYKLPEGAYLEALIKRVPGLIYDKKEGKLMYEGQEISEININGEEFFGNDKKMALENLPAKLVGKLKVYDKRSEKEKFTGVDDGEKRYVLDLETKKELNKTWLTNVEVGYGNKKKKDFGAQANYFNKNGDNFSLILRSTNRYQNSSYKDNIDNTAGLNVTRKFSDDFKLSGSVNYNKHRSGNLMSFYQEQYLPTGNQYSSSVGDNSSKSRNFSANFSGDGNIDKRTRFQFHATVGVSPNEGENSGRNATFDAPPGIDQANLFNRFEEIPREILVNRSDNRSLSEGKNNNYQWSANVMRKLDKEGKSTVSLDFSNSTSKGEQDNYSLTNTVYYRLENLHGEDSVLYRNQYMDSPMRTTDWRIGASFTQVISKRFRLQASYNWNIRDEQNDRDTYELSGLTTEDTFGRLPENYREGYVDSLSNRSWSHTSGQDIRLGLSYQDTIWRVNVMLSVSPQKRSIDQKVGRQQADTTLNTLDFRPVAWVAWNKGKREVNLNYNGSTRQPSLSSLMPLTDNSNPLYITHGNPDLKRTFSHSLRLSYRDSDIGLSGDLNGQIAQNSVTQVVNYDLQTGGREVYPININGNWSVNGGAYWWKHIGKQFRLNLNVRGNYNNRVSMVNEGERMEAEKSTTRDTGVECETRISYVPSWGGVDFTANWRYQQGLNSLNEQNNVRNRTYDFGLEGYVDFPFGLQLRTDARYTLRSGTNVQEEERDEVLWNAGATWRFLKEKQAELSVYWSDILSDEQGIARLSTSDGFYEIRSQQMRGYFLLSFKYNFRLMM